MNYAQISKMIESLLARADGEVEAARLCVGEFQQNSWIVHMTASHIFAGIADALMEARKVKPKTELDAYLETLETKET